MSAAIDDLFFEIQPSFSLETQKTQPLTLKTHNFSQITQKSRSFIYELVPKGATEVELEQR